MATSINTSLNDVPLLVSGKKGISLNVNVNFSSQGRARERQYLQFSVNLRTWWLVRSLESKPGPAGLQAKLILPGSKGEGGVRLYFAYVFCPLPYAGLKNRGLVSSMGQFVGEWKRLGAERTVAQVPGELFRQAWQVTSHITHLIAPLLPPPPLPSPSTLPPSRVPHSFFQCSDDKWKKKLIWFIFLPWLVGVYNLIPRSCHQFDQEVFIYNT